MEAQSPKKALNVNAKSHDWDGTFQLMSWWKKDVVNNARVMVVGAGALGNEVLKNLTLLNVGNLFIVDFDAIEYSNLSRSVLFRETDLGRKKCDVAAERVKDINPGVKVKAFSGDITVDIGLGVFRRMDVVIGCLDNRLARLFLNRSCYKVNKTWIDGAIENLSGQINVHTPYQSCYECSLSRNDWKHIEFRLGCPDIARRNHSQGRIPTTPISSSIIGAIQAQEALKVINGDHNLLMNGEYLYYEGRNNLILQLKTPPLKDICSSHFSYDPIVESPLSHHSTVKEALDWLSENFKDEEPIINLDNALILKVTTKQSEETSELIIPKPHFTEEVMKPYRKVIGEDIVITDEVQHLDRSFPHQELTLAACGIPALHILRVWAGDSEEEQFIELTADEGFLDFK